METQLDLREHFHLAFLRHLSHRLAGRRWAVKGGICLRFFHRSPRMSEDIDLDVDPRMGVDALRKAVDSFLAGRSLPGSLADRGVTGIRATLPKQTRTVQRWKISLLTGATNPPGTKIEFSRRRDNPPFARGMPDSAILERHSFAPFAAQFYPAPELALQKIAAMASGSRNACRDLFDLDHIFAGLSVEPAALRGRADAADIGKARDKADGFSYASFREEVPPYLDESMMQLYGDPAAFNALKSRVLDALGRIEG